MAWLGHVWREKRELFWKTSFSLIPRRRVLCTQHPKQNRNSRAIFSLSLHYGAADESNFSFSLNTLDSSILSDDSHIPTNVSIFTSWTSASAAKKSITMTKKSDEISMKTIWSVQVFMSNYPSLITHYLLLTRFYCRTKFPFSHLGCGVMMQVQIHTAVSNWAWDIVFHVKEISRS